MKMSNKKTFVKFGQIQRLPSLATFVFGLEQAF